MKCFCRLTQELALPWSPRQKAYGIFEWIFAENNLCQTQVYDTSTFSSA